jgi:hypothetical protein
VFPLLFAANLCQPFSIQPFAGMSIPTAGRGTILSILSQTPGRRGYRKQNKYKTVHEHKEETNLEE